MPKSRVGPPPPAYQEHRRPSAYHEHGPTPFRGHGAHRCDGGFEVFSLSKMEILRNRSVFYPFGGSALSRTAIHRADILRPDLSSGAALPAAGGRVRRRLQACQRRRPGDPEDRPHQRGGGQDFQDRGGDPEPRQRASSRARDGERGLIVDTRGKKNGENSERCKSLLAGNRVLAWPGAGPPRRPCQPK
jgi:hypothetical protein